VAAIERLGVAGLIGGAALVAGGARGADLPEDSAETLYHSYTGGGVNAHGPAVLVRKSLAEQVSLSASYYVDRVSSASIDVVTTASPYKETRIQRGASMDILAQDAIVSISTSTSNEPDYKADRTGLDVAQDLFGGLTTVKLGATRGQDDVRRHGVPWFSASATHWEYRLGLSQVITPRLVAALNLETDADTGYLGSPYRAARVFGTLVPERDPTTRTSRAIALRVTGAVGDSGSVRGIFRYFHDTWNIHASTAELGYGRHLGERWMIDGSVRHYHQTKALFYSDNFTTEYTFMSRNRQLGTFTDNSLALSASYRIPLVAGRSEVRLTASVERVRYRYDDFTDLRTGALYAFGATLAELSATVSY